MKTEEIRYLAGYREPRGRRFNSDLWLSNALFDTPRAVRIGRPFAFLTPWLSLGWRASAAEPPVAREAATG